MATTVWWRAFLLGLRGSGYDDVLSIEHEDLALPPMEGVRRSVDLLRYAIDHRRRDAS